MKHNGEMTLDQSPVIVSKVTKAVSDIVKEKHTNFSLNFTWHNHFGQDNDPKNVTGQVIEEIQEPQEVKQLSNGDIFKTVADHALNEGIFYDDYIRFCKKAYLEIAMIRSSDAFDTCKLIGKTNVTLYNHINQLKRYGYDVELPPWYEKYKSKHRKKE